MAVTSTDPALMTIEEASRRLGFAKSYVYSKFITTGKIKTIRFGPRARRVPASEIDRFIREALDAQYGEQSAAS